MSFITVKNLNFKYPNGTENVLNDVSLEVKIEDTLKPFSISFVTEKRNIISKNIKIPKICILGLE